MCSHLCTGRTAVLTQPWGAPVLIVKVLDIQKKCIAWMHWKSLWIKASAKCINVNVNGWEFSQRHYLSIRKLVIHWQTEMGMDNCVSLFWRVSGMMVLKAELKSTNRILTLVPGLSRCCRMKCSPMLTASSTYLHALYANCRGSSKGPVQAFK